MESDERVTHQSGVCDCEVTTLRRSRKRLSFDDVGSRIRALEAFLTPEALSDAQRRLDDVLDPHKLTEIGLTRERRPMLFDFRAIGSIGGANNRTRPWPDAAVRLGFLG